jgi:hypothetical protein
MGDRKWMAFWYVLPLKNRFVLGLVTGVDVKATLVGEKKRMYRTVQGVAKVRFGLAKLCKSSL